MTHPHIRPYGPRRKRTHATESGPDLRGLDDLHRRLVTDVCEGNVATFKKDEVLDADILTALITGQSYQGRQPWPVDPKGVRVVGGRVETQLDLRQTQIEWPVMLTDMELPKGVNLAQARTRTLVFDDTTLERLYLFGTIVKGLIRADKAIFNNPKATALSAQGAEITDGLFLTNATFNGQCDINGAKIGGQFIANKTKFNTPDGIALNAQSAEVSAGLFLNNATLNGQCTIADAKIGGQLQANNATFNTPDGIALWARGAEIAAGLWLQNATLNGQCTIAGAKIEGHVNAIDATFTNPKDITLHAQGAEISDAVLLRLANLNGICDFNTAKTGPVFLAGAKLTGQFRASFGARIKQLDLSDARLVSARHHFIDSDFIGPRQPVDPGPGNSTVIDLIDAHIGRLDMPKEADSLKGIVNLTRCHVEHFCDHSAAWPDPLIQKGTHWVRPDSRLDPDTGDDIGYYELNGFTYDYLASPDGRSNESGEDKTAETRKRWLLSQHAFNLAHQFNPQPWRQMAARLEAQGHDDAARTLAIYRRRYQRHSNAVTGRGRIFVSLMLDLLSHYGFNPWRTLGISAGVIFAFALIYGLAAVTGPMPDDGYQPAPMVAWTGPASDANANPPPVFIRAQADDVNAATSLETLNDAEPFLRRVYPDFNPLLYSLDVFVPVLDLGMDHYWRPNPNHTPKGLWGQHWMVGSILYWLTILQRFMGAILIAIMVTSFTGLLTREDKRG